MKSAWNNGRLLFFSVSQARPERQTAASWLAEDGVNVKKYYYWLRQICREAYKEMTTKSLPSALGMGTSGSGEITFAEIPVLSNDDISHQQSSVLSGFHADAVVRLGTATIAVSNTVSADLLGRIFAAVNHAC